MVEGQREFALCRMCAKRESESIKFRSSEGGCFICKGLTSQVDSFVRKVAHAASRYEFRTFAVGLILPAGVQDREDELRSEYKIRGGETIKAEISRRIADGTAKTVKRHVDRASPDLTVLIDAGKGTVEVTSRSLYIYCRYSKPRGVAQKKRFCERCSGRGCERCAGTGYERIPNVEEVIENRLRKLLRTSRAKFTWLGTEDEGSLVFPPGRPVIIEVKSPMKRSVPKRMILRTECGTVRLMGSRILEGKPTRLPSFYFKTRAMIKPEGEVSREDLRKMAKDMTGAAVQYRNNKGRTIYKKVRSVHARCSGNAIDAEIILDGGLPVRRLISGESVSPSFSELLKTPLNCQSFDILKVWESGSFEYGEV